jgi:hypothetical protein
LLEGGSEPPVILRSEATKNLLRRLGRISQTKGQTVIALLAEILGALEVFLSF